MKLFCRVASRRRWRCELHSRRLKTVADDTFEVGTRSQQYRPTHTDHSNATRRDQPVLSRRVGQCELGITRRRLQAAAPLSNL